MLKKDNFVKEKKFWRYGGEGATHKIWPGFMQQFPRNLCDGWTDDGCLRHDSSSADKVK